MTNGEKKFTVKVQEDDNGNLILPIPDEILEEMNWKEGDVLKWQDNQNETYSLIKKDESEKELVLVETISTFRIRYVVEVPKGKSEWALDTVILGEAKEFSQKHIEESIFSHRVISEKEYLEIFDEDLDYLKSMTEYEKKKFITKDEE